VTVRRSSEFALGLVAATLLTSGAVAQEVPVESIVVGELHELKSNTLGEERHVSIWLPPGYDDGDETFPVLYMTDAEWNYLQAVGLVDYLARWARIPEMIVVAVHNTQRGRDLTPSADPNFIGTGGAERFLEFFERELIPWIDERYRTADHRLLWGHSFGGVFAFYALTQKPEVFDIYISAGASLWLSNQWILQRMQDLVAREPDLEAFLYFTAGEGDGGPTEPSNRQMADWLKDNAPAGLEWHYVKTARENHFTNVPITLQHGLQTAYPIWGMDRDLYEVASEAGVDGVASWLAARQEALGDRFVMPEFEIVVVGFQFLQAGHHDVALAIFDVVEKRFPDSGYPLDGKGLVYEAMGDFSAAAEWFERALRVGIEHDEQDFMLNSYRQHLERVRGSD
jgi:predicted alpha/beta superfamily hydrolase